MFDKLFKRVLIFCQVGSPSDLALSIINMSMGVKKNSKEYILKRRIWNEQYEEHFSKAADIMIFFFLIKHD